ncbi:DUF2726 domain-containing protein [Anaerolineae bacterium CFX7]|nr:DUF2726 domain-containing protein [Anaerolineae bacterium CFX7]RIK17514.1 MAG: hypothetical protein DCC52_16805 [Chloroflexota bacterium]
MSQALGALTPVAIIIVGIVVVGLALVLVMQFVSRPAKTTALPNSPLAVKSKPLMTDAERAFFHTLNSAVGNRYEIFPQLPFSSLVARTDKLPPNVWGIVQNSRADFVLAHPKYLGVVAVIELDDSSHQQATTREKDSVKDRICADAKIPLLRFRVGEKWDAATIRAQIDQVTDFQKDGIATHSSQRPPA